MNAPAPQLEVVRDPNNVYSMDWRVGVNDLESGRTRCDSPELHRTNLLATVQWILKAFIQPCYSLRFYRSGVIKGLGVAILSWFSSRSYYGDSPIQVVSGFATLPKAIDSFFRGSGIRSITIEDGVSDR